MPGISKKPSFSTSHQGNPHHGGPPHASPSPHKQKTVRLAENPHVSAFLSPKSRVFTGGHGYPGVPARHQSSSPHAAAISTESFNIAGKQLTPDEVAQKIASMLKPGPPFFSRVSNADLIDYISDGSIMNCDKLRAASEQLQAKQMASRATAAFVPSGTVVRRRAEEERWTGVGTVWSSLESLPAGASWGRIPGTPTTPTGSQISTKSLGGLEDDGLWNAITLSTDLDCTAVELAKSVVVPTQVLQQNNFFNGNAQSLFDDIGAGVKYKFDTLLSKGGLKSKASSANLSSPTSSTGGSKVAANYLSLSAYTDPNAAFGAQSFELKWPSWMPWVHKKSSSTTPATPTGSSGEPAKGGQKRVWIPSRTKVSIHASWWGYNIYLPEAILTSLDGDVDEAEKIANLVNTCLTYILNNVPAGLPPAFATVLTILKAIAPTTGYISTFIGWSWDTIKGFNKGQGIVLSATWILPVALIPRPWDAPAVPAATTPTTGSAITTPTTPATSTPAASVPSTTAPAASAPSTTPTVPYPTTGATGGAAATIPAGVQDVALPVSTAPPTTPAPPITNPTATTPTSSVVLPNLPNATPAPGATLPPTNPSTVPLGSAPPPSNDTTNAIYPGDVNGRGGDQTTSAPMGNAKAPANQVPIDALS